MYEWLKKCRERYYVCWCCPHAAVAAAPDVVVAVDAATIAVAAMSVVGVPFPVAVQ